MGKRTTPKKPKGNKTSAPTTTQLGEQLAAAGVTPDTVSGAPVKVSTTETGMGTTVAHAGRAGDLETTSEATTVDSFSTPTILRALEQEGANVFRFIPDRLTSPKSDGRIVLPSMRYAEWIASDRSQIEAGVGIGPEKQMPGNVSGFALSNGGVIVPMHANDKLETIEPRKFFARRKEQMLRFVDWASFEMGPDGKAVAKPYNGEEAIYVEVWTGDAGSKVRSRTLQLIQGGVFSHGSVAMTGSDLLVNAHNLREGRADTPAPHGPDVDLMPSQAELVGEVQGDWLAGHLLWINRMWRLRFSRQHSEEICVKHLGRYFVLFVKNRTLDYVEGKESDYSKSFERLTIEQKLVPIPHQKPAKAKAKRAA